MATPNLRKKILTGLVESFFIAYAVNLTLDINTCFDKNSVQQNFQNSRHNLSENKLRSLFVAKEGEAFSYAASITNFVLVMQNYLVLLHYFKKFTQDFYKITQKSCFQDSEYLKTYPQFSESSDSFQKCQLSVWKNLFMP